MAVKKLNRDAVEVLEAFIRRKERKLRIYIEVLNMLRIEDGVRPRELGELSVDLAPSASSPSPAELVDEGE